MRPALAAPPGLAQLVAVCEAFFDNLERRTFPAAASSLPRRRRWAPAPGRSRNRSRPCRPGSRALVRGFAATALEQHEPPAREDPDRLALELRGIMLATDINFVLHDDPAVLNLAREIIHQRLGVENGGNAGER